MAVEKSAGAVIFYNENGRVEYLLLKHRPGSWGFPKGLIEKGEGLQETAARECREEAGLKDLFFMPDFKETIKHFFKVKYEYQLERGFKMGQVVLKFVTYFLAQSKTRDVKISFEHEGYEWLSSDKVIERLKKRREDQKVFKKANDYVLKHGPAVV